MNPLQLALWGLAGGFVVEGLELVAAIRRVRGWPWRTRGEVGLGPYLVSVLLRLAVSGILAAALGTNGQVSGPAGALMIGITAPLIVEKAFRHVAAVPLALAGSTERTTEELWQGPGDQPGTRTVGSGARLEEAGDVV